MPIASAGVHRVHELGVVADGDVEVVGTGWQRSHNCAWKCGHSTRAADGETRDRGTDSIGGKCKLSVGSERNLASEIAKGRNTSGHRRKRAVFLD